MRTCFALLCATLVLLSGTHAAIGKAHDAHRPGVTDRTPRIAVISVFEPELATKRNGTNKRGYRVNGAPYIASRRLSDLAGGDKGENEIEDILQAHSRQFGECADGVSVSLDVTGFDAGPHSA